MAYPERVTFIGSVVVPSELVVRPQRTRKTLSEQEQLAKALQLTFGKRPDAMPHFPQTPQLGEPFFMDPEATKGFPFLKKVKDRLVYDLMVKPDVGGVSGEIASTPGTEEQFNQLENGVRSLVASVMGGDREGMDGALNRLLKVFPDLAWQPSGMKVLLEALKDGSLQADGRSIKIQISGFINTAQNLYVWSEEGGLVQGGILQNQRMLEFHAGLILARTILWAQALAPYTEGEIVCSSDEPCFGRLDERGGPRKSVAVATYETVWGNPAVLGYKRFVHVCDSLVVELLPFVDYLNFDALEKGELVVGHGPEIGEFMEQRKGSLVLGIVPTLPGSLEKALRAIGGSGRVEELWERPELGLKRGLIDYCSQRALAVVDRLVAEGVPRELIFDHLLISPQCGLGGWAKLPDGPKYSALAYGLTIAVADEIFGEN